jgi:integration host factor subunit alpha
MSMALTKADMASLCSMNWDSANAKPASSSSCSLKNCVPRWPAEQVKLSGFGNFDLRDKNQRPGRNPKTGKEIPITARRVVTFRPGQKLKARVEAYAGAGE